MTLLHGLNSSERAFEQVKYECVDNCAALATDFKKVPAAIAPVFATIPAKTSTAKCMLVLTTCSSLLLNVHTTYLHVHLPHLNGWKYFVRSRISTRTAYTIAACDQYRALIPTMLSVSTVFHYR